MEKEDGEMSDDEMLVDEVKDEIPKSEINDECVMLYKAEKDGLIVKKLEKVDASRLEERANRFGLNLTGSKVVTQKQIDELYANSGIDNETERHYRLDTIHLSAIDGLTTREIFKYLEDYKPLSLESTGNGSCNIVCQDHISAALALLVHSREIKDIDIKNMISNQSDHHWREGIPHPKKNFIFMRFATNGDKKMPKNPQLSISKKKLNENYDDQMDSLSKNPWGDLCRSWGVHDHQEFFHRKLPLPIDAGEDIDEVPRKKIQIKNKKLAMRLGKRRNSRDHDSEKSDDSSSDSDWKIKTKTPRMRMHADDEESKLKKKPVIIPKDTIKTEAAYPPLSIEVLNCRSDFTKREPTKLSEKFKYHNVEKSVQSKSSSVLSRLGKKVVPVEELLPSDEESLENSECNVMSMVQKVNNEGDVWSRLDNRSNTNEKKSDLRHILKSKTRPKNTNDLREKLGRSKKSNLRIEIDND